MSNNLQMTNLRLKLTPIFQLIGFASSANTGCDLPAAYGKKLAELAEKSEKILTEAFND